MTEHLRMIANPETSTPETDRRLLLRVVLYALALKLLLAMILPLGIDESYAISVAREYSLSFFEHPPVSFWLPVIFADLTGVEHPMIYRAPFLLAGVITTVVMYLIGREIGGTRVGLWTALLFAASPFFLVSAGIFSVPDGPLDLASAVTVLFLVRIAGFEGKPPLALWLWAGLALAFALGSKYQAAWIPLAVLLFMVLTPRGRGWFLQPGPWLGVMVGLLGLLPVLIWNMQHDWISFTFHGGRAGGGLNPQNLGMMLLQQAVFLLPTGMIVASVGLWRGLRPGSNPAVFLLAVIALGPILIFNYVYLTSGLTFAHWTMPGWQFALPLAGLWLVGASRRVQRRVFNWTRGLLIGLFALVLVLASHANTGFLTRSFYDEPPRWDHTLWMFDFRDLGPALQQRGLWDDVDAMMATSWTFAGILDTAIASKKPMQVFSLGSAHHYPYLSDARVRGKVLYMEPNVLWDAARTDALILERARKLDPDARLLPPIILTRGGQPYISVTLVLLTRQ